MRENQEFHEYYSRIFKNRWQPLRKSLEQQEKQVLFSPFVPLEEVNEISWLNRCIWLTENRREWPLSRSSLGVLKYYVMDPASVLVARALEVNPSDQVLDMCAAPGGKMLVILSDLGPEGILDANELSTSRRERLKKVIQQYVPFDWRSRVFLKGKDGLRYGLMAKEKYNKILVDAPCSGERHLLKNFHELSRWKLSRVKNLVKKQYGLLTSAVLATRPGGKIVYSTCALNEEENDNVVERLLQRKRGQIKKVVISPVSPYAEETQHGWIHLPDRCGFGPLYFSVLEKVSL